MGTETEMFTGGGCDGVVVFSFFGIKEMEGLGAIESGIFIEGRNDEDRILQGDPITVSAVGYGSKTN